ncbi:translocation protein TolB [Enhygromyxa salina]|uniref:Translocation protein TolB n=1 Tax=Enhygromyxa salina TaxID=215803 RepID=A0A2S9XIH7_9BACT|nr:DPP IV N-terminal domain-containing protein [Enhygromyxa salina]PRP92653.1 translocation protein TolB [Enhygromyxa salina]
MPDPAKGELRQRGLRGLLLACVFMLAWLLPGATAHANPDLKFRTITTEHFVIHYHVGEEEVADRAAMLAERAYERLTLGLAHAPSLRTHIVITDTTDSSNGFANAVPYPRIRLFAAAPGSMSVLGSYDDWLDILVTHEFVHVVHIDTVHGVTRLLNAILGFGTAGKVLGPNIVQPRWIIEGLATMYESDLGAQGRYRSALFNMFMRMAVLEGRFQRVDQINSDARVFPYGSSVYLYGLHIMHYIGMHYGKDKLAELSHVYGSRLVPWGINRALKDVIGVDFDQVYEEFQTDLEHRFFAEARQIRARGLRQGRRLTFTVSAGASGAHTRYPVWAPDDRHIYFFDDTGHKQSGIRRISAEGSRIREGMGMGNQGQSPDIERVIDIEDNGRPSFIGPNEDQIVFDMVGIHDLRYRWSDLYRWKGPDRRGREQLTFGLRARSPDVSPDGRRVAFVRNDTGQTRIGLLALDTLEVEELAPLDNWQQVYDPDWHPDGTKIAYSAWRDGGLRDIYVYDLETETHERITADRAQDNSPEWSPDGRWLLFSSDRSGVYNIHAYDTQTKKVWQVSNVLGGAFEPGINHAGDEIAYVGYSSTGYDVWKMDFDPEAFLEPMPAIPAWPSVDDPTPERSADAGRKPSLDSKPYRFYRTFYPRTLLPAAFEFEFGSLFSSLGLTLAVEDVIGFHSLVGSFEWLTEVNRPSGSVFYRISRLFPTFSFGFGRDYRLRTDFDRYVYDPPADSLGFGPDQPYQIGGYLEQITAIEAEMDLPVLRLARHTADLDLSYSLTNYKNLDEFDDLVDPNAPASNLPSVGNVASLNLGFTYDTREGVRYAWGSETGRRLRTQVTISDQRLGSDYGDVRVSGSYAEYLRMPWPGHQILALRLSGGASAGGLRGRGPFRLGGLSEEQDVIRTVIARTALAEGTTLRGYNPSEFSGLYYGLFNAEYRIPLLDIDRGVGSVPGLFERIVGVVFTDWGMAWTDPIKFRDLAGSIGATLITSLKLGYGERVALFFQYAHGLDPDVGIDYFRVFVGRGF